MRNSGSRAGMIVILLIISAAVLKANLTSITNKADYLIIYPGNMQCAALTDFAKWRSSKGLEVLPVLLSDIYKEFKNDSLSNEEAVRYFMSYALQAWQDPKPGYALLIGSKATLAPLRIKSDLQIGEDSIFIDELFAESIFDSDNLPDLALGRIPADDTLALAAALSKIRLFEDELAPSDYTRDFLLMADSHDGLIMPTIANSHVINFLGNKRTEIITNDTASDRLEERQRILSKVDQGNVFVAGYFHCNTKLWFYETQLGSDDLLNYKFSSNPFFFTTIACKQVFSGDGTPSMAEILMLKEKGGAAGCLVPSTIGYVYSSSEFLAGFYNQCLGGINSTFGEAMLSAKKTAYGAGISIPQELRSYTLMGDPALKLPYATAGVERADNMKEGAYLSPNPIAAGGVLTLTMPRDEFIIISLFDLYGRKLADIYEGSLRNGEVKLPVDFSRFAQGTYYIKITGSSTASVVNLRIIR